MERRKRHTQPVPSERSGMWTLTGEVVGAESGPCRRGGGADVINSYGCKYKRRFMIALLWNLTYWHTHTLAHTAFIYSVLFDLFDFINHTIWRMESEIKAGLYYYYYYIILMSYFWPETLGFARFLSFIFDFFFFSFFSLFLFSLNAQFRSSVSSPLFFWSDINELYSSNTYKSVLYHSIIYCFLSIKILILIFHCQ